MKSKKMIMGYAALLILFFHFYIPFGRGNLEQSIVKSAYIGVDLFFFVSGFSLAGRKDFHAWSFYKNRLISTFLPFVLLTLVFTVYKKLSLIRTAQILSGWEFLTKGGGAFLWFLTGILFFYLITPLLLKIQRKLGIWALIPFLAVWAVAACICQFGFGYRNVFILLNRFPIFAVGLVCGSKKEWDIKTRFLPLILLGIGIGALLVYRYGALKKLNTPFPEMYYLAALPLILSILAFGEWLCGVLPFRIAPLEFVGKFTLELYGLQMIFGYDLEGWFLKKLPLAFGAASAMSPVGRGMMHLCAFVLTALVLMVLAYAFSRLNRRIGKAID